MSSLPQRTPEPAPRRTVANPRRLRLSTSVGQGRGGPPPAEGSYGVPDDVVDGPVPG